MRTQKELLKESIDIKDRACVEYQKKIELLEKENWYLLFFLLGMIIGLLVQIYLK